LILLRRFDVTCYFRHLQQIFEKAGIEVTKENKHEIDRVIHSIVHVQYSNCPAVWKEVKKRIRKDEDSFISALKEAWNKRM
jgi:molecular chaperone GrpE (heat shock protein)